MSNWHDFLSQPGEFYGVNKYLWYHMGVSCEMIMGWNFQGWKIDLYET